MQLCPRKSTTLIKTSQTEILHHVHQIQLPDRQDYHDTTNQDSYGCTCVRQESMQRTGLCTQNTQPRHTEQDRNLTSANPVCAKKIGDGIQQIIIDLPERGMFWII